MRHRLRRMVRDADVRTDWGGAGSAQVLENAGAIAKARGGDAHSIHHGEIEVVERGVLGIADVSPGLEGGSPCPGKEDGKVIVVVAVAIANAASVEDHALVEECALAFGDRTQFAEEVGELFEVEPVDLRDFLLFFVAVAVV